MNPDGQRRDPDHEQRGVRRLRELVAGRRPISSFIRGVDDGVRRTTDEVFTMNADGSGATNISDIRRARHEFYPAWSPQGDKIVFDDRRTSPDLRDEPRRERGGSAHDPRWQQARLAAKWPASTSATASATTTTASAAAATTASATTASTTAATAAASTSTASTGTLRGLESARAPARSREAEDPGSALLGRQGEPRTLEALAARPSGLPVAASRLDQATELPGHAGARPGLTEEDSYGSCGASRGAPHGVRDRAHPPLPAEECV